MNTILAALTNAEAICLPFVIFCAMAGFALIIAASDGNWPFNRK